MHIFLVEQDVTDLCGVYFVRAVVSAWDPERAIEVARKAADHCCATPQGEVSLKVAAIFHPDRCTAEHIGIVTGLNWPVKPEEKVFCMETGEDNDP